jgi:myxalamid-type nonribosomal peptide synthetase MxaA
LPEYMLPSAFVFLTALPLTPNGKVDRKALPAPGLPSIPGGKVLARTRTEGRLGKLWAQLLGLDAVGVDENFFELGGHSLLVMRLLSLIKREFGVDCPVHVVFDVPTVAALAPMIDRLVRGESVLAESLPGELEADIVLDPAISVEGLRDASPVAKGPVFFTGGTGFLGAFLLRELLDRTDVSVHCLVRAASPEAGLDRLLRNLERFGIGREGDARRLIAEPGDLGQPRMGLSVRDYDRVSSTVESILHNGAVVDFVKPYRALREANVLGTGEIFRLATSRRRLPVHLVSTVSVFPPQGDEPRRMELESDPLLFRGERIHGGYAQSKWVGDRIAFLARARGVPVTIYRPGSILGATRSGMGNLDDIFHLIVKGCIELGMVPDVDMWANFMPADFVAASITELMLRPSCLGGTFHLVNPVPVPWDVLCERIRDCGYDVEVTPYAAWLEALTRASEAFQENALVRVLPFFQVPRETFRLPWFDDRATRAALASTSLRCPPADAEMLRSWLQKLIASGFLPPVGSARPTARGKSPTLP